MAEQKKQQTQEQDLNHLLKVRREKLAGASGGGKGSLSDHQIPGNASQPGDKR